MRLCRPRCTFVVFLQSSFRILRYSDVGEILLRVDYLIDKPHLVTFRTPCLPAGRQARILPPNYSPVLR